MNSRSLAAQLHSCFALIGFCLWLLVSTTPGWSQVESGRIVGTVHMTRQELRFPARRECGEHGHKHSPHPSDQCDGSIRRDPVTTGNLYRDC